MVYNPSSWGQRIAICCIAFIAVVIAAYMGIYQWGLISYVWDPVFGGETEQVLNSGVSHALRVWMRVPDAIMGAFAYIGDIIFALAGSDRRWRDRPWIVMIFGLDVIPLGIVSATLVFLQGTVVGAWCFPCLAAAVISLVLVLIAFDEVWCSLLYLRALWKKTKSCRLVWNTFWGQGSPAASETAQEVLAIRIEKKRRRRCGHG
jgi:uncharacterized membrane protein